MRLSMRRLCYPAAHARNAGRSSAMPCIRAARRGLLGRNTVAMLLAKRDGDSFVQGVAFYRSGETLLAILVRANATSEEKYNFLSEPSQPLQLGMNFYKAGESIPNHAHLPREILVGRVQEAILIGEGKARLVLYDERRERVADVVLERGDLVLLTAGGHGFEILEDTKILEVKQGPYDGKSKDKVAF